MTHEDTVIGLPIHSAKVADAAGVATMCDEYRVKPKSPFEAAINDVVLRETTNTRLIFRSELITNRNDAADSVHGQLMHQKRHTGGVGWQDVDSFSLANLKGGEEVKLSLDADATRKLYRALGQLYRLPVGWTAHDEIEYVVVDKSDSYVATGQEKQLIEELIESEGARFWEYISELKPGLLEVVALRKEQQARQSALAEFERHMQDRDWTEPQWQEFLSTNEWIFGHNLAFQFCKPVREQAHVGGTTLERTGGRLSDWMLATEAEARFVVLVDIKKPQTELLSASAYRTSGIYQPSEEVTGGVAQLQAYCRTWVVEGSRQEKNAAALAKAGIYTYEPRAILVVGNTAEVKDDLDKLAAFELYRRHLINPEILTFDEMLARARYIVASSNEPTSDAAD